MVQQSITLSLTLAVALLCGTSNAWVSAPSPLANKMATRYQHSSSLMMAVSSNANQIEEHVDRDDAILSRRSALASMAMAIGFTSLATSATAADGESTLYITGKAPKIPGKAPQSKDDVKGTKRDPNFLRSISDCKTQCLTADSNGAKAKEDCLSECQDVCCTTYEQCTFSIVPRI